MRRCKDIIKNNLGYENVRMWGYMKESLREKCPDTEFFWSVFSRIRTEHGDLHRKSPYSVRIRENTDEIKLRNWTLFTQQMY